MNDESLQLARQLGDALQRRGLRLAVAESCTGGLVCKLITDVPGSSAWFERGFITYADAAKTGMLGVSARALARFGAVSETVVREMLAGALQNSGADWAAAVSGVAGPGGGSADKPVGLVWLGWQARDGAASIQRHQFSGDRAAVRFAAAQALLQGLCEGLAPVSPE
ncbi:MAG: CinA family protein [Nevskiales bacterium]